MPPSRCKLPGRKGQKVSYTVRGRKLDVTRTASRSWVLHVCGEKRRRFADTKADACDDVAHFKETGRLPRGGEWPPF
jgi:hypothetical protein